MGGKVVTMTKTEEGGEKGAHVVWQRKAISSKVDYCESSIIGQMFTKNRLLIYDGDGKGG